MSKTDAKQVGGIVGASQPGGVVGARIADTPPGLLFLDKHPGAAAAYSLRKLRSGYGGDAVRVRRSSDNNEENFGFSGGTLDTSALTSFVSQNGYVVTWYDQSGNGRDATQSTQAKQPQIVSSGNIIKLGNEPTILFDGVDDILTFNNVDTRSVLVVAKGRANGHFGYLISSGADFSFRKIYDNTYRAESEAGGSDFPTNDLKVNKSNNPLTFKLDKYHIAYGDRTNKEGIERIGGYWAPGSGRYWTGEIQEVTLFADQKQSEKTALMESRNQIYGAY